ncbi:MAG: tetratricopeptide repeat protein [Phaeodactylibacter sp.]|nr:tetratricopeptide repeat protein [Phaeodactylibacter sp.]
MSRTRQLAAIMFTDIQGYTALMQQNEQKALQARSKHRRIFNSAMEKYNISGTYGMADIRLVQGRFRDAAKAYKQSLKLAERHGEPALRGTADLYLGLGDLHRERGYFRSPIPNWRPMAAQKARLLAKQGRLAEALDWVRERGLSMNDSFSYLREYEHITLTRVRLAECGSGRATHSIQQVLTFLERLCNAALTASTPEACLI